MKKLVFVVIMIFTILYLMQNFIFSILVRRNSEFHYSKSKASALFIRLAQVKDARKESEKINNAGGIEQYQIQNKSYDDSKSLTRGQSVTKLSIHSHEKDRTIGLDKEDKESEYLRLKNSPYILHEDEEKRRLSSPPLMSGVKLVSEWHLPTPFHNGFEACRYNQCKWVANNSIADAVMFRASSIRNWPIKPFHRKPGQRWIMYTSDPAAKSFRLDGADVANQFNATLTYQLDSDYPRIFGRLRKIEPPLKDYDKIFEQKIRPVAWFVSHCKTWGKRESYVERMRKIIRVDIFGACGDLTCAGSNHRKDQDKEVCLPMLSERYKFYLSFENSLCQDYVTEKFFKLFQDIDVIPVVRGGVNYKKNLPSNVFIDASDFKTPEDLAHYLLKLSRDKTRYLKMLKRKAGWTFVSDQNRQCTLCEGLHTDKRTNHFYPSLYNKFHGRPSGCQEPRGLEP